MNWFEPSVASEFFGIDRSQDLGVPWYRHTFCTEHPGRVDLHGGPPVLVDDGLDALRRADTVVIPGWSTARDRPSPALVDALRRAHARGARLVRFCTGAFTLAATGVLDGRRATTHWRWTDLFAARYPAVCCSRNVLFVDDVDVLTAAGSAALHSTSAYT